MNLEDIREALRHVYEKDCDICGMTQTVLTQGGSGEYQTEVYVQCNCGNYLEFILPVN